MPAKSSEISPTVSGSFFKQINNPDVLQALTVSLTERFVLGCTHYITLLTFRDARRRSFYEKEASENGWGYRELERQNNLTLYEHLVLSRDENEVKKI